MTEPNVHPTAIVDDGAVVGDGTRIWVHAHVRDGARVGRDCILADGVYVDIGAVVGDGCKIQNNVSVYQGVTLEDDVFVGPSAAFTNDRFPRATTRDWELATTLVRRGASIGANATIVCGHEIGAFAMVAAGAVVTGDIADHELVAGNPAQRLGWVCDCGRIASREHDRPEDLRCERCRHS